MDKLEELLEYCKLEKAKSESNLSVFIEHKLHDSKKISQGELIAFSLIINKIKKLKNENYT